MIPISTACDIKIGNKFMIFAFVDIYAIIKFGYDGSRIESPVLNNIKSVL